jgi:Flp pilus assembly protein TadD
VSAPAAPAERPPAQPGIAQLRGTRRPAGQAGAGEHAAPRGLFRSDATWWVALLIAAIICFVAFVAGGGLHVAPMTAVEMALTLGGGLFIAGAVLLAPGRGPGYGGWSVGLLLAFAALTALSVVWSVEPDHSWLDAGRMLAYSAVFGASVTLVRAAPARWPAMLGGVTLAAVAVCGYALLTKVFPAQLDANDTYARLRAPYDYWNAIGLTAAMGVICCMWLAARRAGHGLLSALAYPAMGLMLVTLMLAYSRGALVALALGLVLWFCVVPLRLRGAAVLLSGGIGAGIVVAWTFSTHALSAENVAIGARTNAGHQLGVLLVAMLGMLAITGLAIGFQSGRRAPSERTRRNAGAVLLALIAVAVIGFAGALAASHRGFSGSISHALNSLTNTHARVPNTPDRLTAIASARAQYWNEALKVFTAHPPLGSGAEGYATARLRYRNGTLAVRHAHGFLVQTLADLGLVGLLVMLALLAAWMAAAGRCTHPFNRRWTAPSARMGIRSGKPPAWRRLEVSEQSAVYTSERVGLLSMLCVVVVFGVHSLLDWTWYVPGDACVALLCAGWLAGRGPLTGPRGALEDRLRPGGQARAGVHKGRRPTPARTDIAVAAATVIAALLAAWAQWQPQRSIDASQRALSLLAGDPRGADAAARTAVARDPLSAQALFILAEVQRAGGRPAIARATLQRAVRLQPSNPETWAHLGEYDASGDPRSAVDELRAAVYLNPQSIAPEAIARGNEESIILRNDYVDALRATAPPPPAPPAVRTTSKRARGRARARR